MKSAQVGSACCAAVGVVGALACSISMFAVPLGIVGAGIAAGAKSASSMPGMPGMGNGAAPAGATAHLPAWIGVLNRYGPEILIVSVLLVVTALALRRSVPGVVAAVIGGIVLYYGMYAQPSIAVMAGATIVGLLLLMIPMFELTRRQIRIGSRWPRT